MKQANKKTTYKFFQHEVKSGWNLVLQDCPTGSYFFLVQSGKKGRVRTLAEVWHSWEYGTKDNFDIVASFAEEINYKLNSRNFDIYCKSVENKISKYFGLVKPI